MSTANTVKLEDMALLTPVLEGCVPKSKRVATTSIMFDPEKFVIAEKLVLPDPPVANVVFVLLTENQNIRYLKYFHLMDILKIIE